MLLQTPAKAWFSWALACGILTFLCVDADAQTTAVSLKLQVSSEISPAGSSVQFKIRTASPALIASGAFAIDLDPTIFGDISDVTVFAAAGDAIGYSSVTGRHAEVHFSSTSGSIGQLTGMPVAVVSAPVNVGSATAVAIDPSLGAWLDPNGRSYDVTAGAGEFHAGGKLWVGTVTPGGGYLPAGTVVRINGGGFDATTQIAIDGVSLAAQRWIGSQQMEATLAGATEMTGKRVIVSNGEGARQEFYTAIPSAPAASVSAISRVFPIVPLNLVQRTVANSTIPSNSGVQNGLALLNQNLDPVTVTFLGVPFNSTQLTNYSQVSVTVPPSTLYFLRLNTLSNDQVPPFSTARYWVSTSAPIRMLGYSSKVQVFGDSVSVGVPTDESSGPPPVTIAYVPDKASFSWQLGTAAPAPATLPISSGPFQATTTAPWIRVSQSADSVVLTPNFTGLAPGSYQGSVVVTPVLPPNVTGFQVQPSTILASLTVSAGPLLTSPVCCAFLTAGEGSPTSTASIPIASNGEPVAFTVTTSGEKWLGVNVDHGTTPATIMPVPQLSGLAPGNYSAEIQVHGSNNMLKFSVVLTVISTQPPPPAPLKVFPESLRFVLEAGSAGPASSQAVTTGTNQPITYSARTLSGGDWLKTAIFGNSLITVNATAVNLTPGTYSAEIVITTAGLPPATVPVTLTVLPVPTVQTALRVTPAAIVLDSPAGIPLDATIRIESDGPVLVRPATASFSQWLQFSVNSGYVSVDGQYTTPATLTIHVNSSQPGTFRGAIIIKTTNRSITVPVTFDATATEARPPQITAVVNAASGAQTALAPGEIFSIFGQGIGTAGDPNATSVSVNGVAAPLLYASGGQVNAVVPFETGTPGIANVKVSVLGISSHEWGVPAAQSAPAIFTIDASGAGQGAVLNEDSSVNGASNPAARGSVVQIFGTGQGITSPASVTGAVSKNPGNPPVLPVKVTIGGIDAVVQYRGAAPGLTSGAIQVNAVVPAGAALGSAVPLAVWVGDVPSQAGVTIAVR